MDPDVDALRAEIERLTRRVAELELLADRDPLAPVLNRRAFLRELSRTQAFLARYGGEAALAFFDLDGFKAINDSFGHAAGDAALRAAAQTLVDHVRETDVVARLGGDEFAVILTQTPPAAARAKARALAERIGAEPVVFEGRAMALSASVGVRAVEPGVAPAELLAAADAAMYLDKRSR
jgi:diguanylate cyclase (GGDEF)-like protein